MFSSEIYAKVYLTNLEKKMQLIVKNISTNTHIFFLLVMN